MDLEKILNSAINRKILRFFDENPYCIDTAKGIAAWTGLAISTAQKALKNLVISNLLIEHKTASTLGYAYTQNKMMVKNIKHWLAKADENTT
ncbi:MAG: hypothetical protein KJ893_10395 [Candidatus Omnitrophica bacterium]|nr:hypothetical protein [Candidatus Omnitrophota bacterium]MBU4478915.1 hypothetical protein [Candidatus Omnitrophota bacterium]MCG2704376.1 hypothetical protein [Candidatus Omnitrophota bacterium]